MAHPEREDNDFANLCAKAGEKFTDYAIIVRMGGQCKAWKFSSADWAMGAMTDVVNAHKIRSNVRIAKSVENEMRGDQDDDGGAAS
mgnify:CR=1 FL=1